MKITKRIQVGSLESSDCMVTIEPSKTLSLTIKSSVSKQFYKNIEKTAYSLLKQYDVENCSLLIEDRGALPFALKARIEAAILKSGEKNE